MPRLLALSRPLGFLRAAAALAACLALANGPGWPATAAAAGLDQFRDPEDGWFDTSDYLIRNAYGFLPVPIIITEPAVDNGLGLAGLFIHAEEGDPWQDEDGNFVRPSMSMAAGAYTGNDSWFAGAGHLGVWRDDHIRYTGFVGYGSVNLTYYGAAAGDSRILERGVSFNSEGLSLVQNIRFRIGGKRWYAGPEYQYSRIESRFDAGLDLPVTLPELDARTSGLGLLTEVDTRDSNFTPNRGTFAYARFLAFGTDLGSDYTFQRTNLKCRTFLGTGGFGVLGLRADAEFIGGRPPFYARPFIVNRGIPAMRYQGNTVISTEAEFRWDIFRRIAAIGFLGVGWAAPGLDTIDEAPARVNRGFGGRYLMARKFSMWAGLDLAWGPEDFVWYITVGQAWR